MATVSVNAARRDPILVGLVMLVLGLILSGSGMVMNQQTHTDLSGLIFVIGLAMVVLGFFVAALAFRKPRSQKTRR